ncbi:hypothetical protein [Aggregatilinea lenta]|uniref:hypothetical protein n=1 Tax=Aggregatilinea lenta TaxID=913108 RepID=UPI000E5BACC5|nr:hypothetical protein [Aggregatilinea lenta]
MSEEFAVFVKRVWIEEEPFSDFAPNTDSADVLVEMDDGQLWQAQFVTPAYLRRELEMSLSVARDYNRALAPTPFLTMETPHIIVENLQQDTIEDVVDNLVVLGTFESAFSVCAAENELLAQHMEV